MRHHQPTLKGAAVQLLREVAAFLIHKTGSRIILGAASAILLPGIYGS